MGVMTCGRQWPLGHTTSAANMNSLYGGRSPSLPTCLSFPPCIPNLSMARRTAAVGAPVKQTNQQYQTVATDDICLFLVLPPATCRTSAYGIGVSLIT